MDLVMGFACGIAVYYLINYLRHKQKAGEEELCNCCTYKKAVMETLEDVQAQ